MTTTVSTDTLSGFTLHRGKIRLVTVTDGKPEVAKNPLPSGNVYAHGRLVSIKQQYREITIPGGVTYVFEEQGTALLARSPKEELKKSHLKKLP